MVQARVNAIQSCGNCLEILLGGGSLEALIDHVRQAFNGGDGLVLIQRLALNAQLLFQCLNPRFQPRVIQGADRALPHVCHLAAEGFDG